ncbi:hypothetical protein WICPIJ_002570 [Wickerhamomyces pijperi]|uniref:Transmembrane protein n=1 Tax=Wickerhamomyces pijperi TaxID=599730 RepID=A0A9P8Q9J9_WICPI|nr:hypothetical protein WICPIJ_002570 [Wickerhamomyces pijperi]
MSVQTEALLEWAAWGVSTCVSSFSISSAVISDGCNGCSTSAGVSFLADGSGGMSDGSFVNWQLTETVLVIQDLGKETQVRHGVVLPLVMIMVVFLVVVFVISVAVETKRSGLAAFAGWT